MCECMKKAEGKIIGQYKEACLCEFGPISTTSREGVETIHGWGVNFYNYKVGHDHAWEFKFCPWCGKEIKSGA
jgi:hypothetical protein